MGTAGIASLAEANREAPEEPHKETQGSNASWDSQQQVDAAVLANDRIDASETGKSCENGVDDTAPVEVG